MSERADLPTLRVLIADERAGVVEALADMVRQHGHVPIACENDLATAASAVEREQPHVAIVEAHTDIRLALDLIDVIGEAGGVPVIATIDHDDAHFIADAAERGVVVHHGPLDDEALDNALRVAHAQSTRLGTLADRVRQVEARMVQRAVIERAKGVLMERNDLTEPEAYELLRRHAREAREPLTAVADAVLRARRLLPRGEPRDGT